MMLITTNPNLKRFSKLKKHTLSFKPIKIIKVHCKSFEYGVTSVGKSQIQNILVKIHHKEGFNNILTNFVCCNVTRMMHGISCSSTFLMPVLHLRASSSLCLANNNSLPCLLVFLAPSWSLVVPYKNP